MYKHKYMNYKKILPLKKTYTAAREHANAQAVQRITNLARTHHAA